MYRLHVDQLQQMMKHDHFAYLRRWLEEHRALIVFPDDIRVPDGFMPGTFRRQRGRWGIDEPLPPLDPERQMLEDANARAKALPAESVPLTGQDNPER